MKKLIEPSHNGNMLRWVPIAFFGLWSSGVFSGTAVCAECSKSYKRCIAQATFIGSEIQECQIREEEYQDSQLKTSYRKALKRLSPERQRELREVQKKWETYRVASTRYYIDNGLSGYKIVSSGRYLQITISRIKELNETDY